MQPHRERQYILQRKVNTLLNVPNPDKHLKIFYYNARSLIPKFDELKIVSEIESPDIFCIEETWLSNTISDNEIVLPNYQCVRRDRDRHGGGVLIFIHSSLAYDLLCPDVVDCELLVNCFSVVTS